MAAKNKSSKPSKQFIENLIIKAGKATLKLFRKTGVEYTKEDIGDVVTKADLLSQKILLGYIKKSFPTHGIVSEEIKEINLDQENLWIIDPLDGTRNFATGVPIFGIMVAFTHKKEVTMAAIYLPYNKELYFAEKRKGAFLNGKKITCSKTKNFEDSYGCGPSRLKGSKAKFLRIIGEYGMNSTLWFNAFGSAAVAACYTAAGRRDWYSSVGGGIWDYAAPSLLLKEAGYIVTDEQGNSWKLGDKSIVAGNKYTHKKLLEIVKKSR